jgi:hypothetical protein
MISEWNEQHVSVMFAKKCFCENTAFKNMKCTRKGMLFVTGTNTLLQTLFGTRFSHGGWRLLLLRDPDNGHHPGLVILKDN